MMNIQWDSQALDFVAVLNAKDRVTMEHANKFCDSVAEAKALSKASTIREMSMNIIRAMAPRDAVIRARMIDEMLAEISIYFDGCIVHANGLLDEDGYAVADTHCVIPDFDSYGDGEVAAFVNSKSDAQIKGLRLE